MKIEFSYVFFKAFSSSFLSEKFRTVCLGVLQLYDTIDILN